jgi:hypothetical protein
MGAAAKSKAQIASIDLVISVAVLMLFIAIIIIFFPSKPAASKVTYGGMVFTNIEMLGNYDSGIAFLSSYGIDDGKLAAFSAVAYSNAETLLLNNTGYGNYTSDFCMFFVNSSKTASNLVNITSGQDAYGIVFGDKQHTAAGRKQCSTSSPCGYYNNVYVYAMPVVRQKSVMNLYVIVCSD